MLNTKEVEIVQAIALGKTNKEIANSFLLSLQTVKRKINAAKSKLNATNRANLIYIACQKGILQWPVK